MADIVDFTNKRKAQLFVQRDFMSYTLGEIESILKQIDTVKDHKELILLMDKLHKFTESLHAIGFEFESSFGKLK